MRQFTKQVMAVMCGGALGAVCRVELSRLIMSGTNGAFPFGILFVNMLGSFLLGLLMGAASRTRHGYPTATAFMATEAPASTPMISAMAAAALAPPGTHLFTGAPSSTTHLA